MKAKLVLIFILYSGSLFSNEQMDNYKDSKDLDSTIKSVNEFQKTLTGILNGSNNPCHLVYDVKSIKNCQVENYCQILSSQNESAFIRNDSSGVIFNERLYELYNKDYKNCLKSDLFKEEISNKVEEYTKNYSAKYLLNVLAINKKLTASLEKNKEHAILAKINQELISQNLLNKINNSSNNESIKTKEYFQKSLSNASSKLKLKLSNESSQLLIELNFLSQKDNFKLESQKFEDSLFPDLKSPNIFYDFNNFTSVISAGSEKQLVQNQIAYSKSASEVYAVFQEAKVQMVEYLKSTKNKFNSSQIDRAIARINLIKFSIPTLSDGYQKECEKPNAFYSPKNQSIIVCPQWFNSPKIFLLQTLAHELGHSIDACNLQYPLKIKSSSADEIVVGPFDVNISMETIKQSEVLNSYPNNFKLREQDQRPILLKENPFFDSIQCLQSDRSIGAIAPNKENILKNINNRLSSFTSSKTAKDDPEYNSLVFAKEHLDDYFARYGACNQDFTGGVSQLQEAFADKIASEIIARKLKKMSRSEAQKEIEKYVLSEISSDGNLCPEGVQSKKILDKMREMGCPQVPTLMDDDKRFNKGLKLSGELSSDSHPKMINRIEKILMAHPEIRKILNCQANGVKYCE